MKNVLVLCTGNSCRSQMAHGYLKQLAGDRAIIYSAGIETHGLNQDAVSIMLSDEIDISKHTSNHIDEYQHITFDLVLTVCDNARENCPYFPTNAKMIHQNFEDPSKMKGSVEDRLNNFKKTRDEIKYYCQKFAVKYF
jgi:arsenate reductase (thioredoxin)